MDVFSVLKGLFGQTAPQQDSPVVLTPTVLAPQGQMRLPAAAGPDAGQSQESAQAPVAPTAAVARPRINSALVPKGYVPGPQQTELLISMTDLLVELQAFLRMPVTYGCGLRSAEDVKRLIAQGYNPSRTSDHFYAIPMPQKDGSMYVDSCGAADVYITGLKGIFGYIVDHYLAIPDPVNRPHQIIYEVGKFSDWLHIANTPAARYGAEEGKKHISPRPLLYSPDCGKTYLPYDPLNPPALLKKSPAFKRPA